MSKMGPVVLLPVLLLVLLVVVVVVVIFRCIYIYTGANNQRHEATTPRDSPSPNNGWFVLLLLLLLLLLSSSSYDCMIYIHNTRSTYRTTILMPPVCCGRFRFPMWMLLYFASVRSRVQEPGSDWNGVGLWDVGLDHLLPVDTGRTRGHLGTTTTPPQQHNNTTPPPERPRTYILYILYIDHDFIISEPK